MRRAKICINENCFNAEIAETQKEREQGLMSREKLNRDEGMLFEFNNENRSGFWMKNTLIPLDIIWIGENKQIIYIYENAEPCEEEICPIIGPEVIAKYVLEINGGIAKEINLKVGDTVSID